MLNDDDAFSVYILWKIKHWAKDILTIDDTSNLDINVILRHLSLIVGVKIIYKNDINTLC